MYIPFLNFLICTELAAIDPTDELADIAQEECLEISSKIRNLLKKSARFFGSLHKYDTQDAYLEVTAGAGQGCLFIWGERTVDNPNVYTLLAKRNVMSTVL